ncbi:MAG: bacillithiol biosynthesis BshC [Flavobacteriia bacterium]|nr:bacillithiol biosynthesis BshC [Flavobacteriia bacterium]
MILESILHDHSPVPSKVMKDLIAGGTFLESIAKAPYHWENFADQTQAQQGYSSETRAVVANAFERQNPNLSASEKASLQAFRDGATTITTGHQLMVCGGTVFFEAKVLGAVALARAASKELGREVVPVFWMASEDHDFEEIASFRIGEHQFTWKQPDAKGPVGYLPTQDLADQLSSWLEQVPLNEAQKKLVQPRLKAYREGKNLAEATRQWVRQWAEGLGLLVLDGQDMALKGQAAPLWDAEMGGQYSKLIHAQTDALVAQGYNAQVFPREINLFDLRDGDRQRFEQPDPECPYFYISPNALMRPLYQEWLLPNLAYVGGGGELAYWLQLGGAFQHLGRPMPLLYLRNSVVVQDSKLTRNLEKLGITLSDVLASNAEKLKGELLGKNTVLQAEGELLQAPLMEAIDQWNASLVERYPELQQHAAALKVKMEKLAQRTSEIRYRTQKRRHEELMRSVESAIHAVYPGDIFWERRASYADLVGILGQDPRDAMVENMSTIKAGTIVIQPDF